MLSGCLRRAGPSGPVRGVCTVGPNHLPRLTQTVGKRGCVAVATATQMSTGEVPALRSSGRCLRLGVGRPVDPIEVTP